MNDAKKAAIQTIDDHAALFCDVSRKIWEYAELSLKEFQSAALYEKVLAENGFAPPTWAASRRPSAAAGAMAIR